MKSFKKLMIFSMAVLLIWGCSKQENLPINLSETSVSNEKILSQANRIGENLPKVLDYLIANINLDRTSENEKFLVINEFLVQNATSSDEQQQLLELQETGCSSCNNFSKLSLKEWLSANGDKFTETEQNLFYKMNNILEKSMISMENQDIEGLKDEILESSSSKKLILLSSLSLIQHGLRYMEKVQADDTHPFRTYWNMGTMRIDPCAAYLLSVGVAAYNDCLQNGGWGPNSNFEEVVQPTCVNQAYFTIAHTSCD